MILGHPQAALAAAGGQWTAREIAQQPAVWEQIDRLVRREAGTVRAFLDPLLARRELRIVLTGAGTSAFVGECLAPALKRRTERRVDPVATTDLVSAPGLWLEPALPTLLVHFARSGNSPESVAALEVSGQGLPDCHHLVITCNAEGALCREARRRPNAHVLVLPPETDDRGFAMTSSFTGMLLAAGLAFELLPTGEARASAPAALARAASHVLDTALPRIAALAGARFERVVYLGGQSFKGLAREAALKLLELSDGRVVALAETPLGFRHGPKTVVNDRTLVVMFLGNEPHARRYELDLLSELRGDGVAARVLALCASPPGEEPAAGGGGGPDDLVVTGAVGASDLALCFPYAVFAQAFAFLQSLELGLKPDTPNARGVVNRVVRGVSIYPWDPAR
jgi:tagatose-6-phosphate ketose/aldose isomerase